MLQRFDGYRIPLAMKRIVLRHVTEAASQRLMIQNGDIDVARDLSPDDLDTLSKRLNDAALNSFFPSAFGTGTSDAPPGIE